MIKYQIQWKYSNGFDSWRPSATYATYSAALKEYEEIVASSILTDDTYWQLAEIIERVIR